MTTAQKKRTSPPRHGGLTQPRPIKYSSPPKEHEWDRHSPPPYLFAAAAQEDRRFYRLFFLDRHRELVLDTYLPRVRQMGRDAMARNRQRKLYTNVSTSQWSHVVLEHPKTFATLAMDPARKKEIMDDLDMFRNGKEYHARVGKAWKRGYLLYGPPGTGKSAMIAAMANYLDYDIYDIELTSVHSNSELRKLFIETKGKSIIVIEDIDCSLDLSGARKKKNKEEEDNKDESGDKAAADHKAKTKKPDTSSKVMLPGLLNFIDGLWSACGAERLIVFTTNHVEKLDPALIRRGRMDKHIEMSYCGFEAFKFLAERYLGVVSHEFFDHVRELLQEVNMTPADVAENLTLKSVDDNATSCLASLVRELQEAKKKKKMPSGENAKWLVAVASFFLLDAMIAKLQVKSNQVREHYPREVKVCTMT
ncbi:hypothetical protein HU200_058401 [Digitaria exilis]|uniref:AAA+ ATPase domain-containing protein n=1 Tax=Digitaria exilis TaxID=1010633 RepID=A0A835E3J4_9POAL|nr:hypothetical protein HU200_058401 [Digitaria exilis]